MEDCYWILQTIYTIPENGKGVIWTKLANFCDFGPNLAPIAIGFGSLMSGKSDLTTWRAFGISSRISGPTAPNLHPRSVAVGVIPRPPMVGYRAIAANFYRILKKSRSMICADIVKISQFPDKSGS